MSRIKSITSSTLVSQDLATKIGINGVNEIISVLWKGYHNLKNDISIQIDEYTEEDYITQKWFEKVQLIWHSQNRATAIVLNDLVPMHQYADAFMKKKRGKKSPTIDFCFKDWTTSNSYFGAEAKNLYEKRKDMIKRYVSTGVKNYTIGRYGSQSSKSSIIGYVLSGKIPEIVQEIKSEIQKDYPIYNLTRVMTIKEPIYHSKHMRTFDHQEIILFHLFFDFTTK